MIHGGLDTFFTPATALLEILMERVHREESDTRLEGDAPWIDRNRLVRSYLLSSRIFIIVNRVKSRYILFLDFD